MAQLDGWIDAQVIEPLFEAWEFQERVADEEDAKAAAQEVEETRKAVHKDIKEKVLESYHNGQKAKGSRPNYARGERSRYGAR